MPGQLLIDNPADGVVRLTISNPSKRNALDHAILDALAERVGAFGDARCLLLSGEQGMFSSGYDTGDVPDDAFSVEAERLVAHPFTAAIAALDTCPIPTLAAPTGHAIGGGLELALSCDLRVAHDSAPRDTAGEARPRLLAHRPAPPSRHAWRAAHERLFLLGGNVDAATALL